MESRSTTLFGEVADAQIFDRCVGELIKTPGTILRSDFGECDAHIYPLLISRVLEIQHGPPGIPGT